MSDHPIRLFDLPHAAAQRLLRTGAPVFLSINPVEYHGPHLSLHNDALVSAGLARDLHARLARTESGLPFVVGADLEIGVEPTPGPGTRFTPYVEARRLVREACRALAELGAKRVVLMTFHGAPLHNLAIEAGLDVLRARHVHALAPFNTVLHSMLMLDPWRFAATLAHVADRAEREQMRRNLKFDFHAGFFETSVTLHYAPESVDPAYRTLPPCPPIVPDRRWMALCRLASLAQRPELSEELRFAAFAFGWNQLDPFPGYTGWPHQATAAAGSLFANAMIDEYAALAADVFAGRKKSPPPIMRWAAPTTLNGRLAQLGHASELQ